MPEGSENVTLPGGFESVDKMWESHEKLKAEAIANKTKAADRKALEDELSAHKADADKRKQSEMTELEKAQARIAALEGDLSVKDQAVAQVRKEMLLERVLSAKLGTVPESHRKLARMAYERASFGADYADEETLNALLDPVDKDLEGLNPTPSGVRSINTSAGSPGGKQAPQLAAKTAEILSMTQGEIRAQMRAGK